MMKWKLQGCNIKRKGIDMIKISAKIETKDH